jgi:hypothetical protein
VAGSALRRERLRSADRLTVVAAAGERRDERRGDERRDLAVRARHGHAVQHRRLRLASIR